MSLTQPSRKLPKPMHVGFSSEDLLKKAIENKEGRLAYNGSFTTTTGERTGRSPGDKFIVRDKTTDRLVDWGKINQPIEREVFEALWDKALAHLEGKEYFISNLRVGADPQNTCPVRVITEYAWHQLFAQHLFIHDSPKDINWDYPWVIINVPTLQPDPKVDGTRSNASVMLDFTDRRVLICGMRYAGEMKKAMFSVMNFVLPDRDVLPMHCAANLHKATHSVALFFGLSGTGKTTLSADLTCQLIGDDEHGWSSQGVFNFEGGCYAKCIHLSEKNEPVIWQAIGPHSIMENVVLEPDTGVPDFSDDSLTQNTRAAYPIQNIPNHVVGSQGGHPKYVIFLTCDLYGVLPPVACLNTLQAAYYFLSGYTALVGSTEVGSEAGIKATFSACFGAPFFPRSPNVYAELLMRRVEQTSAHVYLVNTGWTGGGYHTGGKRFSIDMTRRIVHAILKGEVATAPKRKLPGFNFEIPELIPGVQDNTLDPKKTWEKPEAYEEQSKQLRRAFIENFKQFEVPPAIREAGPKQEED